jgi:dihydrofolate synthase/folylpolyglutamate synthase
MGRDSKSTGAARPQPPFARYDDAWTFLLDRVNVERTPPGKVDKDAFKFERTVALMDALGNPQRSFRVVHVAGSKGKGSVCEMTASALQGCGFTTALYTSPHLVSPRERLRINQRPISEEDFRALAERVAGLVPQIRKRLGEPTFFELLTAMAFLYFAEQAVDIAVVEVGLGGRLDCTNVVLPEVSLLTAIQLEHRDLLGDTLEAIAGEKAGIIKPGIPAITIPQSEDVLGVFRDAAAKNHTTLSVLGREIEFSTRVSFSPGLGHHAKVCLTTRHSNFEHVPVPLMGEHQAFNCGLALAALDQLRAKGMPIPEDAAAAGLAATPNFGRLEFIHDSPRIAVDGAHNPESVHALVRTIGAFVKCDTLVMIFGCAADKDIDGMLAKVALGADKVIFTKASGNARAAEPRDLLKKYHDLGGQMGQAAPTLKDALNTAAKGVSRGDLICVTGSFYLAGEAKALLDEKHRREHPVPNAHPAVREVKPTPTPAKKTKP